MGNTYNLWHFVCLVFRGRSLKLLILAVSQGVPLTAGEASWEHHTHPTLSYLIRGVDLPIFSRLAPSHHRLTELVWCGASNGLPGTLPSTTAAALCSLTRLVILDLRDHDVQVGRWQRSRAACARVCDSGGGVGRCFLLFKILAGTLVDPACLSAGITASAHPEIGGCTVAERSLQSPDYVSAATCNQVVARCHG